MEIATKPLRIALTIDLSDLHSLAPFWERKVSEGPYFEVLRPKADVRSSVEAILQSRPDGIVSLWREELAEPLANLGIPIVYLFSDILLPKATSINVDEFAEGYQAGRFLLSKGIRHLGLVSPYAPIHEERERGLERAARESLASFHVHHLPAEEQIGPETFKERLRGWLRSIPKPVGILAVGPETGPALLNLCQTEGIRVPGAVSVLACDCPGPICQLTNPGLSSLEKPWAAIARLTVESIILHARDEPAEEMIQLPPGRISERASTGILQVNDERVERVIEILRQSHHGSISISEVAARAGLHRRTLERLFIQELGQTPHQFLIRIRTEQVRVLLETTELPIGRIAERCGFARSEQCAAAFRNHYGQTPRQWRKWHRQGAGHGESSN